MQSKTCEVCGTLFYKTPADASKRWEARKFCSNHCAGKGKNIRTNTEEDFYSHFQPEPNSGCWLWTSGTGSHGYGVFALRGESHTAHTFSYRLHHGEIPKGMYVLHKCDVRLCVNPDHLSAGTQKQNIREAVERNRIKRGENSPAAKLTESDIRAIRSLPLKRREVAKIFGVSQPTITAIVRRREWSHVK
jgi:HNH endonuclease